MGHGNSALCFLLSKSYRLSHMYSSLEKLCTNPKSGVPRRSSSSFKNCSEEECVVLLLPPELQQTMSDNQKAQISVVISGAASTKLTSAHLRIGIDIICSHSLYLSHAKI
jgi:hypothetical protein